MKNILIKAENLCKTYFTKTDKFDVIKGIDLEIYEGDFTVIMGSSGAGKSTLLYMLSTMDNITSGKVELLGEDISKYSNNQLARLRKEKISFIFQGINLLDDLNLRENVEYIGYSKTRKRSEIKKEATELLSEFGLKNELEKMPSEVSGGQKQRTAIARALINHPQIIFADEPTGALNSSAGKAVLDLLTKLNKDDGQSIVMVTHDPKAAIRADRLLYIKDGKIDEELTMSKFEYEDEQEREKEIFEFLNRRKW